MGMRSFGKVLKSNVPWNAIRGFTHFASKATYLHPLSSIKEYAPKLLSGSSMQRAVASRRLAIASAQLMGGGAGITMTTRLLEGRNPLKNRKGRYDVPFVPFV